MFNLRPERPDDGPAIEALLDTAFGPGRFAKTAYRLREGVAPVDGLSFVAEEDGALIGSIRYWPVSIGGRPALMLGPIAVLSSQRDPFRVDTPANHRDAQWLAEQVTERLGYRTVHLRGLHYVLLGSIKPDGSQYVNNEANWTWLSEKATLPAHLPRRPWIRTESELSPYTPVLSFQPPVGGVLEAARPRPGR